MKALVVTHGFIGDTGFATSIAKSLKEKMGYSQVDYYIPLIQPKFLLEADPYIDNAYVMNDKVDPNENYDNVIQLGPIEQNELVTIQYQKQAGIAEPTGEYKIHTVEFYDSRARTIIADYKKQTNGLPVIGFHANWEEKSFRFTKDEYWKGVDVPYKGYGGRIRDINLIRKFLEERYVLVELGLPPGINQTHPVAVDPYKFAADVSLMKYCDYVVGGEGGITNYAAGVGTKCIITTDFIAQLYGPNGVLKKFENPKMGPAAYFPNGGHSHLNPYLSDEEVAMYITSIIDKDKPEVFDWSEMR